MNTAISNFYTSIVSAFSSKPVVQIDSEYEEPDYIGKGFLAGKVSPEIMEAICQYDLWVISTENSFVWYSNGQGLNIRIWEHNDDTDTWYDLKINNQSIHSEVPFDLLNDLIITELQIP